MTTHNTAGRWRQSFRKRLRNPLWLILVILLIGLLAFLLYIYTPLPSPNPRAAQRVIEMGWNTPKLQAMPDYIDAAQSTPFDGVIFDAETLRGTRGLSWRLFGSERIPQEESVDRNG